MTTPHTEEHETPEDRVSRLAETATVADGDTEGGLSALMELSAIRRKDPMVEQRYELLRNQLARVLGSDGARWFLDADGNKWLAYTVAPEKTKLNLEKAVAAYQRGEISAETLDLIAPRKQDLAGLRKAVIAKHLTAAQIQDLVTFEPSTPYVQFSQPGSDIDE